MPDHAAARTDLKRADEAASLVHDYIYGKNGVTFGQANDAIWLIHEVLRPLIPLSEHPDYADVLAGLPDDLARVLRDPSIIVSQDAAVFEAIAKWANAPSDTASGGTDA